MLAPASFRASAGLQEAPESTDPRPNASRLDPSDSSAPSGWFSPGSYSEETHREVDPAKVFSSSAGSGLVPQKQSPRLRLQPSKWLAIANLPYLSATH
ncbi:unnamed protein product [Sphagnum jensenii]|uniref:Uncharacterized protein n=1 Tax=Sphagnum jensenii TaxID=128206 RepID=A0ABP1AID9_9BRYO